MFARCVPKAFEREPVQIKYVWNFAEHLRKTSRVIVTPFQRDHFRRWIEKQQHPESSSSDPDSLGMASGRAGEALRAAEKYRKANADIRWIPFRIWIPFTVGARFYLLFRETSVDCRNLCWLSRKSYDLQICIKSFTKSYARVEVDRKSR
jgi:hypothetical protein